MSCMGKWIHRLSEVNTEDKTAICAECGPVRIRRRSEGNWRCCKADNIKNNKIRNRIRFPWRAFKLDYCENPSCTATIEDLCQLDVDHIDGDKTNNDPSNLMTLCANCHRLKTKLNKDWERPRPFASL